MPKNVRTETENVFVVKAFVSSVSHVDFLVSNNTRAHATAVSGAFTRFLSSTQLPPLSVFA